LEFGRKDGESCKTCLSVLINHRLKLLSQQWRCITTFSESRAKMLHSTSLITILILFLLILFPMSFHNHNHVGTRGRRVWIIFVMTLHVTTLIFLHSFSRYIGNFQVIFFCDIQVPPKFLPKFRQSLPYTGRSQVIDIYPVYTSNISYLITQNHDPIMLGLNPTHYHQHNTSCSITSYNIVQMKDSISTINMHGQIGTKSLNH